MSNVTAPQFQQDVNNAADWVNGDENTTVTMRLGQQADSPAKVIKRVDDLAAAQREDIYENATPYTVGNFTDGFTYTALNQRGEFGGDQYVFLGGLDGLPHVVAPATDPTVPPNDELYKKANYNDAASVANANGGNVQNQLDIKDGLTVNEAINYAGIASLIGSRVWLTDRQAWFNVVLTSTVTPNSFDIIQSVSNSLYSFSLSDEYKNKAIAYGVVESETIDSYNALQAAVNKVRYLELPATFALSQPVLYGDLIHVKGVSKQNCVCFMIKDGENPFGSTSAFIPNNIHVNNPKFENITFVDAEASNVGKGTDSILNGIDITGTFRAECINVKGVRVDSAVFCDVGPSGEHQWTKRPKISGMDGSNVNRYFNFVPTTEDRFPYGDIQIVDFYSTGSTRYGARAQDTDGLTVMGAVIFPDAQIKISGNYIKLIGCHPFEPKAKLSDPSNVTAEAIVIANRNGGRKSFDVRVVDTSLAFAGRLADTKEGDPEQINKSAFGMLAQNVDLLKIDVTCNDPSEGAIRIQDCTTLDVNLICKRSNTQALGSGALTPNTYDSVLVERSENGTINIQDDSPNKRYLAYLDDDCKGIHVTGITKNVTQVGTQIRIPDNNECSYTLLADYSGFYRKYSSDEAEKFPILENSGSTTPSCTYGRNGALVRFDNSVSTNVTDIPGMRDYQEITIHIQDNGATKLVDVSGGGNFRTKGGATILGKGTVVRFMKDPSTGEIVEI